MATILMNKTLDNIIMGVSEQYQEGRREGQVQEMINCVPSITRGVLRRNPVDTSDDLTGLASISSNAFTYAYDRGNGDEQYLVVIDGDLLGTWHIYNVNDTTKHWTGVDDYLKIPIGTTAREAFKCITLRDYTFVVNKTIETEATTVVNTLPLVNYTTWAFYWIKQVTQVTLEQRTVTTDSGSLIKGYKYTLNSQSSEGVSETRPLETAIDRLSADKIIADLAGKEALWTAETDSSFLYAKASTTVWDWEDTAGSTASVGVWKTIASDADLPARLPSTLDGFIVKVTGGTSQGKDDYFLQYNNADSTWDEVAEPGISNGILATKLPHIFYRLVEADGVTPTFSFDTYKDVSADGKTILTTSLWRDRVIGSLETNPDPSFVGSAITDLFFYKNRLGFIANNSIVLSTIRDYGSLYIRSLKTILDDGPIDVSVATTNSTSLRKAVATEDSLIIFSDDDQFLFHSNNEVLTPITASVTAISHYSYNKSLEAIAVGDKLYFSTLSGSFSQLYEMQVSNMDATRVYAEASNITLHLPTYISSDINLVEADTGVGQMFIRTKDVSNLLYVVNTSTLNREKVQQAFHKWVFNDNLVGMHVINQRLYLVFENGTMGAMALDLPGDISDTTYLDMTSIGTQSYGSALEFSRLYYTGKENKGTSRGRLQLRSLKYALKEGSAYTTTLRSVTPLNPLVNTYGPDWVDTDTWDDTLLWADALPDYDRVYHNDTKVTVMSNSENVSVLFSNNTNTPSTGFELETVNFEGLFYQRSSRVIS